MRLGIRHSAFSAPFIALLLGATTAGAVEVLFPFVLPWDDASPGLTNLSSWLQKPAGLDGPIQAGPDGHLQAGGKRLRLSGVDLAFSGNFPSREEAPKIAARMARFGVNIVRFHIMDMRPFPEGILARGSATTRDLDPEALDRLDFFAKELKERGIYLYLCLLNYRPFNAADGLPREIERLGGPFQGRHVVGFFDSTILDLQKEYARKLLGHRNAYTGLAYAEDPALAFVEINNENGLIHAWLGDTVDSLPRVFMNELQGAWNSWLKKRYGGSTKLAAAWAQGAEPLGPEILANGDFGQGLERWQLEVHPGATATLAEGGAGPPSLPGSKSVRITVLQPGTEGWHIRFEQPGFVLEPGRPYELRFWARSDKAREGNTSLEQFEAPWHGLGLSTRLSLNPGWTAYHFNFVAEAGGQKARVLFDPAKEAGVYEIAGMSLKTGGVVGLDKGERLEAGALPLFPHVRYGERSPGAQKDWMRFLWETEDAYWQGMRSFIKQDLGVKAMVIGTINGCSSPNLMDRMDAVDSHAYWSHPSFPGQPWDPENWVVENRSMVNDPGGTIPGLALKRVLGKPFCVTEYGHAAPNPHAGEGNLLRDAYAALQDWDYVSSSRYSHQNNWDLRRIRNFFDLDQHPTRLVALIPAAALFQRGDVSAARQLVVATLGQEEEIDRLRRAHPWELVDGATLGIPRQASLIHRVALAVGGEKAPQDSLGPDQVPVEGNDFVSDTQELDWDLRDKARGLVTINTARSKAVIGYGAGKRLDLGGVTVEPGHSLQDGWSCLTLTAMEGDLASGPCRILITATGYVENTNMGWKNEGKTSVGKDWGEAPSLVEGIPARLTLPFPAKQVSAWALDERGQRAGSLKVAADPQGHALINIGPAYKTLWYEVQAL